MTDHTADYSTDQPEPAPQVPDFELIRSIGRGGFGQVWLAVNRTTGHLRAVKVIPLQGPGASDPAGREITSLGRLEEAVAAHHPNLLDIQHVGQTAEHLFYVMEPADDASGGPASSQSDYRPATLQQRLDAGPISDEECVRHAQELLAGLAHLHAAGMVHRDVKPANCLFVGGRLKLADFGLLTEAHPLVSRVGTHRYMPPDGRMDTRADVYAAGLVIYEMLSGLPVESFPRLGRQARQIADSPVLRRLNGLVLRACQPKPQERFGDAGKMLAALTSPEPHPGRRGRSGQRIMIAAAALLVLAVAVVALLVSPLTGPRGGGPPRVDVNFITQPFEATIYLDGELLADADGDPYTTPCTVAGLPARTHHVVFKREGHRDRDAGQIDFSAVREITTRLEVGQ